MKIIPADPPGREAHWVVMREPETSTAYALGKRYRLSIVADGVVHGIMHFTPAEAIAIGKALVEAEHGVN